MNWVDISVPLAAGITQWPGDPLFAASSITEDGATVTSLSMCAHTGTHIDAPLHYFRDGVPVDALELDVLIGPAVITTLDEMRIGERMLLRTRNSLRQWWREPFREDYDCLSVEQARVLVQAGVRLVGIDYLSIDGADTHRVLLEAGVAILEGLDLSKTEPGNYDLVCLPLKLQGADGAPARAVVRSRS